MSDIKKGDVVVCIRECDVVKEGAIDRVTSVIPGVFLDDKGRTGQAVALQLKRHEPSHPLAAGFNANCFRKLRPANDEELVAKIRACRPIPEQVPA